MAQLTYKPSEISSIIDHIINNNKFLVNNGSQPLALEIIGEPGIGKTTLIIDKAKKENYEYHKLSLAQTDELSDLVGFPIREFQLKNGEWISEKQITNPEDLNGPSRTTWCPPKWVPQDPESHGILILDDWTRADSRFANATMELIEKSEYMSWKLPKNWSIILTSNPDTGDYNISSLDSAQKTRFLSLSMKYDKDDWAFWAEQNNIDSRCINFILLNPEMLDHNNKNINARIVTKFFNSIASITNFKSSIKLIRTLGEASVGSDFAERFILFINNEQDRIPSPSTILNTEDEEEILKKIKGVVGDKETSTYNAAVAGTIATRLLNYIKYAVNTPKMFKKRDHSTRIKYIMLNDIFHNDINYHLTASLAKFAHFEALLQDKEMKRFIK